MVILDSSFWKPKSSFHPRVCRHDFFKNSISLKFKAILDNTPIIT